MEFFPQLGMYRLEITVRVGWALNGIFFPKIMFNKHTYGDHECLRSTAYSYSCLVQKKQQTNQKTHAAAVHIGSGRSVPAHALYLPFSRLRLRENKEKFPTEQELGAQPSREDERDSSVSHGKYIY